MKKILMLAAAVAMLASCTNDATTDDQLVNGAEQVGTWNGEGLIVEASAEDVTRVNTNVDGNTSYLTWEVGDELALVHGGASYVYLAQQAGRVSTFVPKDDANAITSVDPTLPVAAFYNVTSVDPATLKATFAVAAEQTEGELTNKLPLYGYAATTVVEGGKVVVTMKPLASVVEFELSASSTWNADAFSLGVSSRQLNTYASAEGLVVDAATGAVDLSTATLGNTILVNLSAMHDFATKRNVSVVVPGVSNSATTTIVGESGAAEEVTNYTVPVYKGKACVKLYKEGNENFRRTIWEGYTVDSKVNTVAVDERKHVYQPLKDILDGHRNGISSAEDLKALADEINYSVETYPCGTGFCNEDGVVLLNNSIDLSAYENWPGIGHNYEDTLDGVEIQFAGHFDGQNNTVSGMKVLHDKSMTFAYTGYDGSEKSIPRTDVGLFGAAMGLGSIKNLTVKGDVTIDYVDDGENMWCYAGGVVGQAFGVHMENLTNYVNFKTTNLDAKLRVGGIAARVQQSDVDGNHKNLKNYGNIDVAHSEGAKDWEIIVAGIVGNINDGDDVELNFTDCENHGEVKVVSTSVSNSGGCFGFVSRKNESIDSVFDNCDNYGNVCITSTNNSAILGGVAGQARAYTFINCDNSGEITIGSQQQATYLSTDNNGKTSTVGRECYAGGVIGYTNARHEKSNLDYPSFSTTDFKSFVCVDACTNSGKVNITTSCALMAGGIIGYATHPLEMVDCENKEKGTVSCEWTTKNINCAHIGGLVGKLGVNSCALKDGIVVYDSTNYAEVSSNYPNDDAQKAGWSYLGGCFGSCYGGTSVNRSYSTKGLTVEGCVNEGRVRALKTLKYRAGGVAGLLNSCDMFDCENFGEVTCEQKSLWKEQFFGGIAGYVEANGWVNISGCINEGIVANLVPALSNSGEKTPANNFHICLGGIVGRIKDAILTDANKASVTKIEECENYGSILATKDNINTWSGGKWVLGDGTTTTNQNFELRGAIVGAISSNMTLTDCKIGGYIGTIKGFNAETGEYSVDVEHELIDGSTSDWHYAKWAQAWTSTLTLTNCECGN